MRTSKAWPRSGEPPRRRSRARTIVTVPGLVEPQELAEAQLEAGGDPAGDLQRRARLAALDLAEHRRADAGALGEVAQREVHRLAQRAHARADVDLPLHLVEERHYARTLSHTRAMARVTVVPPFAAPDVLVLAGGGVLGEAWMTGVLAGIEDATGTDLRRVEAFVGTSAGSIVAARLAAGRSPRRPTPRATPAPARRDGDADGRGRRRRRGCATRCCAAGAAAWAGTAPAGVGGAGARRAGRRARPGGGARPDAARASARSTASHAHVDALGRAVRRAPARLRRRPPQRAPGRVRRAGRAGRPRSPTRSSRRARSRGCSRRSRSAGASTSTAACGA